MHTLCNDALKVTFSGVHETRRRQSSTASRKLSQASTMCTSRRNQFGTSWHQKMPAHKHRPPHVHARWAPTISILRCAKQKKMVSDKNL